MLEIAARHGFKMSIPNHNGNEANADEKPGFRNRFRGGIDRLREKFCVPSNRSQKAIGSSDDSTNTTPTVAVSENGVAHRVVDRNDPPVAVDTNRSLTVAVGSQDDAQQHGDDYHSAPESKDPWTVAFRDAAKSLEDEVDVALLQGRKLEDLFRELELKEQTTAQDSIFWSGVERLKGIQLPLKILNIALDCANPLTRIEPTMSAVFGVISSASAVSQRYSGHCVYPMPVVTYHGILLTYDSSQSTSRTSTRNSQDRWEKCFRAFSILIDVTAWDSKPVIAVYTRYVIRLVILCPFDFTRHW